MKYIRVYESDCYPEEYVTTYQNHCEHVANLQDAGFDFEGCIVKQANTIEELCDGFVCEWNVYPALCLLLRQVPKDRQKNIYGAIWTNKGLIYVAKMNDEGELELL